MTTRALSAGRDEIASAGPMVAGWGEAGASADGLAEDLVKSVRDQIGAVACFKLVDVVAGLSKTRSGKILRKTMRGIAHGKDEPIPSTIEDPAILHALAPSCRAEKATCHTRQAPFRGG